MSRNHNNKTVKLSLIWISSMILPLQYKYSESYFLHNWPEFVFKLSIVLKINILKLVPFTNIYAHVWSRFITIATHIRWLPQGLWRNHEEYGLIDHIKPWTTDNINGWVQERRNSSMLAIELYVFLALTHQYNHNKTRTIRTPVFWGYPLLPHDYTYYWFPASIVTLAQRRHWSASSRSAADVAPTLVFRRLHCYGMSAFCRSATVGISLFADVLCLDIGGWKSSVSRINVVVQPDYRYINYIFRHHDPKNYCTSNL